MTSVHHRVLAVTALLALAVGCQKDKPPNAYGGGPGLQANIDQGVARLAVAKCDRAARCDHIMPGKKYDSREQCLSVIRGDLTDDIRLKECRGGIDESQLQECINGVQQESCSNPFDKLGAHRECRVTQICMN